MDYRAKLIGAFSPAVKAAYYATFVKSNEGKELTKDPVRAVARWISRHDGMFRMNIAKAVCGIMLGKAKVSSIFVLKVIAPVLGEIPARELLNKVQKRIASGKPFSGYKFIRETLCSAEAQLLAAAISEDTGLPLSPMRYDAMGGFANYRRPDKEFLKNVAKKLSWGDKLAPSIKRTEACRTFCDFVDDDAQPGCSYNSMKLCAFMLCPFCYVLRIKTIIEALNAGFTNGDGKFVEGWLKYDTVSVQRITGFKNDQDYEAVVKEVAGETRGHRIITHGYNLLTGAHELVVFSDDRGYNSPRMESVCRNNPDMDLKFHEDAKVPSKEALSILEGVLLSRHIIGRTLIDKRDAEGLLGFLKWIKGKYIASKTKYALPFPTVADTKLFAKERKAGDGGDEDEQMDHSSPTITFTAAISASGFKISKKSKFPHSIDKCISLAAWNKDAQYLLAPLPWEEMDAEDECLRNRQSVMSLT